MRKIQAHAALFLIPIASTMLPGQVVISPPVPLPVQEFLSLTADQLASAKALQATYIRDLTDDSQSKNLAAYALNVELAKDAPDPAILGAAYADMLRATRGDLQSRNNFGDEMRKLLTREQVARLAPLKQTQQLRTLTTQAECAGFLESPPPLVTLPAAVIDPLVSNRASVRPQFAYLVTLCANGPNPLSASTTAPSTARIPALPPADPLAAFLDLSEQQSAQIGQLRIQNAQFQAGKYARYTQVNEELSLEAMKETLDPMALGVRILEEEWIRRETDAASKQLVKDIQAQLNDAQRAKLRVIEDTRQVAFLDGIAQNEGFLPPARPGSLTFPPLPQTAYIASESSSSIK